MFDLRIKATLDNLKIFFIFFLKTTEANYDLCVLTLVNYMKQALSPLANSHMDIVMPTICDLLKPLLYSTALSHLPLYLV